jgi:tape measure domain-containing protein
MSQPIDTASVLILPDYSKFESETKHGVDEAFSGVEPAVKQLVDAVERIFTDMADQVKADFEEIKFYADSAFDHMATGAEEVGLKTAEDIRRGTDAAENAFDELRRKATEDLDRVGTKARDAGDKTKMGLSSFVGGAALLGGITAVGAGLEQLTQFGLQSAGQVEQLKISFDQLTGSVAAGEKQFKDLQNFAAATPFEMQDVTVAAQRFDAFSKSVGISQQQLVPFLTTIGNVVSVTGGGAEAFNSVSLAMGQIASRGKLTLDNLNQLSNALPGFSGALAIANVTGKTQAQVMDEISKGQISASEGIQDLLKGMQQFPGAAGAMQKQSQTLIGVFSTFHDVVSMQLTDAFTSSIPQIKDTLTQITPIIGDALKEVGPTIGATLTSLMSLAGPLISGLAHVLAPLLNGLAQGLQQIGPVLAPLGGALGSLASALAPILVMAGQLAAALGPALTPIIQALVPAVTGLMTGIKPIIAALVPIVTELGQVIGAVLAPVMNSLGAIFEAIGPPIAQLVAAIGQALSPLLEALAPLVETLLKALDPLWPTIALLIKPVTDLVIALMPLIDVVAQLLVIAADIAAPLIKLVSVILQFLTAKAVVPLLELVAKSLVVILGPLEKLVGPLTKVDAWFQRLNWGKIMATVGHAFVVAWNAVANFFGRLPGMIGGWLSTAWNTIVHFFTSLPGMILNALAAIPGLLERAAVGWFHTLFFAIGYGIGTMIKMWENLPPMLWNLFKNLWLEGLHLWEDGITAVINYVLAVPGRVAAIFTDVKNTVIRLASDAITGILNFWAQLPGRVANFAVSTWNRARQLFSDGVNAVVGFIKQLPSRSGSALSGLWTAMKNGIGNIVGNFTQLGRDIIGGLISGIKSAISAAINVVSSAMKDIYHGALSALGIHSPSKLFHYIGSMSMAGYSQGVSDRKASAHTAVLDAVVPRVGVTSTSTTQSTSSVFGPGSIVLQFSGGAPSQRQAYAAGQSVGQGILDVLNRDRLGSRLRNA